MDKTAAIIPVAGLSSHGESFVPLLRINGFTLVEMATQSTVDGGASCLCVVAGRFAGEIEQKVTDTLARMSPETSVVQGLAAPPPVLQVQLLCAGNPRYETTNVFESIKEGLRTLLNRGEASPCCVFILPGNLPGVSPQTFAALRHKAQTSSAAVVVPEYEGKRGYPLLIKGECIDAVLKHHGEGGIEQALAGYAWHEVAVDDRGVVLAADASKDYEMLERHVRATRGVSSDIVEELFARYQTPRNVHEHTKAVAEIALRMAIQLNQIGLSLDSMLCHAGGELHDLNRLEPRHSEAAADNLQRLGYSALATIVRAHDSELVLSPRMFTEANLVFVADKLVKDTTLVSIFHRYEGAVKRFPPTTELGALIQKDSRSAQLLLTEYARLTGDTALLEGATNFSRREYYDEET